MRPVRARIRRQALRHNYRELARLAAPARVCAVVKADAYGHGLEIVAPVLHEEGCRLFAVTDCAEAVRALALLDEAAGGRAQVEVVALSGAFDGEDAQAAAADARIVPAVFDAAGVARLARAGFAGKVWIKAETGMHRLGSDEPAALAEAARARGIEPALVFSHLACAATPEHPHARAQIAAMQALGDLGLPRSLANSAALALHPEARFDVVRPGIALYGAQPAPRARLDLEPVMRLEAEVMQVRALEPGDAVSYDATFVAPKPMRAAVVAAGYADGVPRALSNRGCVLWRGRRLPILGRVCMDYTIVDATGAQGLAPGERVCFWGAEGLAAEEAALAAGTIPYELFTGVGARVRRMPWD